MKNENKRMGVLNYLMQPVLVANIQRFFGVKILNSKGNEFEIQNKFWYNLFVFGTALGDETFYTCFIPFWFFNIDGAVGRRVILVWSLVMYVGQSIKDIIKWDRPGYPVVKLQSKWALEYGMPSTHAMVGFTIPFAVLFYTMDRYQYYVCVGVVTAICWCVLVCMSRIYLGMHTVLDVIVGLCLTIVLMLPLIPLVDKLDYYFLTNATSPILVFVIPVLMIIYYPNSGKWTPTRCNLYGHIDKHCPKFGDNRDIRNESMRCESNRTIHESVRARIHLCTNAYATNLKIDDNEWILDSGVTEHMTHDRLKLREENNSEVRCALVEIP
ncbi:hypothetical protein FQA39_LY16210 [Lamprigera yunnana]|nr:hypothetical protein FQA39_LY16210 [Lamprigera yunnana]